MNAYCQLDFSNGEPQEPTKAHPTDAGWDLYASRQKWILPGNLEMVHTDLCIALPDGFFGLLIARSSSLRRYGLTVVTSVIDQGYRGEILIQAMNMDLESRVVEVGHRLAQLILLPVPQLEWVQVNKLPDSPRGSSGFGSSGR